MKWGQVGYRNVQGSGLPEATFEFAKSTDGWVRSLSAQAQALWAKSGDGINSLSLPQHLVDSACAAALIADRWISKPMMSLLSESLGLSPDEVRIFYIWLAATHDMGKATVSFQEQLENSEYQYLVDAVIAAGLPMEKSVAETQIERFPHSIASAIILQQWLLEQGCKKPLSNSIASVSGAHHGIADEAINEETLNIFNAFDARWRRVHNELLEGIAEMTGIVPVLENLKKLRRIDSGVLQTLTGLVVMADWIASNVDAFALGGGTQVERVSNADKHVQLTGPWAPAAREWNDIDAEFQQLFSWPSSFKARTVQRVLVEQVKVLKKPSIIILEAETGAGKTEAGLAAAQIIGENTGAQGIFFATPTMATADGLFARTRLWASNSAPSNDAVSLNLAHSKNSLSEDFQDLRFKEIGRDTDEFGNVVARQWFSGRNRGLLSNLVVGTIDQVLMMSLKKRYSMLRHVGIVGKIVIFDEIHSYDVYTSEYIRTTIEWLSSYGVTVIVMTATLPPERRNELIEAYTDAEIPTEFDNAYPLFSIGTDEAVKQIPINPPPTDAVLSLELLGEDEFLTNVEALVGEGGCLLIICNTIARAQSAFRELRERFQDPDEVVLHHSGFIAWERMAKEAKLRKELGPDSHISSGRPSRRIVVATQVAEQSLDIDADALITDFAPMDLLVQRIGRVHRHRRPDSDRPERLREPKVFLRGVEVQPPDLEFESGTAAVYDTKVLISTYRELMDGQGGLRNFRRPDDTAPFVRATYSPGQLVPKGWEVVWNEAVAESNAKKSSALKRSQNFRIPSPWSAKHLKELFDLGIKDSEEAGLAQVRDIEPTIEVIPIVVLENGYRLWGENEQIVDPNEDLDYQTARKLAASTVRLPGRITKFESDFLAVIDALEIGTPISWNKHYLLKGSVALCLEEVGETTLGRHSVRYSSDLGIEILNEGNQ
ncbi:MAG: CRISPR-associated helicase/endonuclease Cas3 [Corynebacterium casei]|uniref:CRISPR-associated protein n=4 Tax=Corynebacterium casei TaxID=160386 RepID=G7HXD0_9CORY|nr:CRISPR-associated helicase/endonuclease Cas3 [Corynebacterium casei]AHI19487.1 CRISPR-associated protein [Corynebacterium casei LMG S-19264]MDN6495081.1 CRISPR-associated helicase/endonuclease Cas3 [Corynebacterium casei]CCE54845.1 CRISPR-associated protein [Corynebacterium casei UCMA 3821]